MSIICSENSQFFIFDAKRMHKSPACHILKVGCRNQVIRMGKLTIILVPGHSASVLSPFLRMPILLQQKSHLEVTAIGSVCSVSVDGNFFAGEIVLSNSNYRVSKQNSIWKYHRRRHLMAQHEEFICTHTRMNGCPDSLYSQSL